MLIKCPNCGVKRIGSTTMLGTVVNCRGCARSFTVVVPPLDAAPFTKANSEEAPGAMIMPRCQITTINGIGIRYLCLGRRDESGNCWATRWIVVCWLPLIPRSRDLIRPLAQRNSGYRIIFVEELTFDLISRDRLRLQEIGQALILGWCVFPVFVVGGPIGGVIAYLHPPALIGRVSRLVRIQASVLESALLVTGVVWGIAWWLILSRWREHKLFGSNVQQESSIRGPFE